MNSENLGDAFDHWKGALIQRLEAQILLRDIAAVPMITDKTVWNSQKVMTYSQLLNLKSSESVKQADKVFRGNKKERVAYFASVSHRGDLFLDPDIGVSISPSTEDRKHITICEIKKLLDNNRNDRVILVYQHRGREQFSNRLEQIITALKQKNRKLSSVTYECGFVAMLFFSYNETRIRDIKNYFKKILSDSSYRVK